MRWRSRSRWPLGRVGGSSNTPMPSLIVSVPGGTPSLVNASTLNQLKLEINKTIGIAVRKQALLADGVAVPEDAPYVVQNVEPLSGCSCGAVARHKCAVVGRAQRAETPVIGAAALHCGEST